jgi:hypothetical protein
LTHFESNFSKELIERKMVHGEWCIYKQHEVVNHKNSDWNCV